MKNIEIIFKSGASTTLYVESYTLKETIYGSQVLHWTTAEGSKSKLVYLDMSEIAAVLERDRF